MKDKLKQYLKENTELVTNEIDLVCAAFTLLKLKQDKRIIEAQNRVNLIGFIVEGILKAVEGIKNGNNHIHYFIEENHFFSEANGLFKNLPAKLSIEAATPCVILTITLEELDKLKAKIPSLEAIINTTRENELVDIIEAQEMQHQGKSFERFAAFIEHYPSIHSRIKDKDIASYLGLSKFTLSRIKKKLSRL
ncbi:MAG: Crp/Fnr family transcriptional regulator [Prolixibacteraceae bacterium]|jgi:CRP-like cAMP-binding protein|nr:Crp/Fnr family transcriptional regulator [Prolixibacteraceae bacterium]